MSWFKSKRIPELEKKLSDAMELVQLYKKQIDTLSEKPLFSPENYIHVPIPTTEDDNRALLLKTAQLTTDTLYLFYFADLRRRIIQQFESEVGRTHSEYFRGQLALIGELFEDSGKARKHLGAS